MVVYTVSRHVTNFIGPTLFRVGLRTRNWLAATAGSTTIGARSGTDTSSSQSVSGNYHITPYMDLFCGITTAQKLLSLSIYDESSHAVLQFKRTHASPNRVEKTLDDTYDALFGKLFQKQKQSEEEKLLSRAQMDREVVRLRLQVLDEQLRPVLVPNDRWSDVLEWKFNPRILRWVRKEFLIAKYGPMVQEAFEAYPQLRSSPQFTRHPTQRMLLDLAKGRAPSLQSDQTASSSTHKGRKQYSLLPSSDTIIKAFGMRKWTAEKDTQRIRESMIPIAKSLGGHVLEQSSRTRIMDTGADSEETTTSTTLLNHAEIPPNADVSSLGLEEILEVAGAQVQDCGPFNTVCEEAGIYQLWTQDFVHHLGDYLWDRHVQFQKQTNSTHDETLLILDIGAGDGLLTHYLEEYFEKSKKGKPSKSKPTTLLPMPNFVATDDGSWKIFAKAQVEKRSVTETLQKYCPQGRDTTKQRVIVLCSWMPMGQDWTELFRQSGVDEYILIGEADDGSCGHNWKTWGNLEFYEREDDADNIYDGSLPIPLSEQDGYKRWDMTSSLSKFQFSRFDCKVSRSSATVSFRR